MSILDTSFPISSISGRYSATDRIHSRANRTTGKTYGVALTRPNPQSGPTPAQQQSREAFRATWQKVDTILSDPAARTYYTALWQAHTAACRHHRPLSQSAIVAIPVPDSLSSTTQTTLQAQNIPTTTQSNQVPAPITNQSPLSEVEVSSLRSRRTPFSSPRTLLFHLLYPTT